MFPIPPALPDMNTHTHPPVATEPITSEPALLSHAQQGDMDAVAELWRRYHRFAHRTAINLTSSLESDDVVAEAFSRILAAFRNGGGPTRHFAPYLRQTLRSVVYSWGVKQRDSTDLSIDAFEQLTAGDPYPMLEDSLTLRTVFAKLPAPVKNILWLSEVQGNSPSEIAAAFDITVEAARARSYRARAALRSEWARLGADVDLLVAA